MRKKISTKAFLNLNLKPEKLNQIADSNYEMHVNNVNFYPSSADLNDEQMFMSQKANLVKESIFTYVSKIKEMNKLKKESKKNSRKQSILTMSLKSKSSISKSRKSKSTKHAVLNKTHSAKTLINDIYSSKIKHKPNEFLSFQRPSIAKLIRKRSISM